jgi:hypothetical protein
MEYDVATGEVLYDLIRAVNERIAQGWQPLGGVALGVYQGREVWAQAMVRELSKLELDGLEW